MLVRGSRLTAWLRSGNLSGSRRKNTGRVVPHEIPVPFLGIEFHRKAPDIPLGIGGAALAGDGGKAERSRSVFLPTLGENLGLGVAGDVMGDGKGSVGTGTLGVHAALGDHLPVKVGEFFQEPDILQQYRAARSCGHHILVVDDRCAASWWSVFLIPS